MSSTTLSVTKQSRSESPSLPTVDTVTFADKAPKRTKMVKEEDLAIAVPSVCVSGGLDRLVHTKRDLDGMKLEVDASPSDCQSPTLVNDIALQKFKMSQSPTPPLATSEGTTSKISSSSPMPVATSSANPRKVGILVPQLISNLPIAREEALKTFNEIPYNNYQYKSLGRSREILESMTCDCVYDHGIDNEDNACGPYSDCINRLTQVECLPDDCRCRSYCQNQRFQNRQYANIEIVQTDMKGYGLRAEVDIPKDTFIYEYVGDVVNPTSFKKRMRDYAQEGIQHFYFMMLQKDEFIDATKNGGIGRFANHSCNPNCFVAKWTIGAHVRMGIFSKRDIKQHEELTFNYNVDRYGHQAQNCYCGEPNCVGYIGGKTQTDIATMDDLYLDALGITDEDDVLALKGTKKKKGKKIDDTDFMPTMKPIIEKDVPKVVQAIRQTQSRKVLYKLLTRIKITDDQAALRQIMRLRGYSLMTNVLEDYSTDLELVELVLQCMTAWPLLNRNKVEDSKVAVPVEAFLKVDHETVNGLAQQLIEHWATLPLYNRIPKRVLQEGQTDSQLTAFSIYYDDPDTRNIKRSKYIEQNEVAKTLYKGMKDEDKKVHRRRDNPWFTPTLVFPTKPPPQPYPPLPVHDKTQKLKESIKAVIASANEVAAAEEAAATAAAAEVKAEAEAAAEKAARRKARSLKKVLTPEEKAAIKEKRLIKLVGAVVVKCMSKYAKPLDRDQFKKYAKELTQVITEKEKKSLSFKEGKLEALSEEKTAKIKKFSKDYIVKILRKLEKAGHHIRPSSSATPAHVTASSSLHTSNSVDGVETVMGENGISMSLEEAMDLDPESDSDGEVEVEERDAEDREGANRSYLHSRCAGSRSPSSSLMHDAMDVIGSSLSDGQSLDPRLRLYSMEGMQSFELSTM